jgi:hypothetical protein
MEITIQSNIPIPTDSKKGGSKYKWESMKPGDSFFTTTKPNSIRQTSNQYGKRNNMKFIVRAATEMVNGVKLEGARVWRLNDDGTIPTT